MIFKYIRVNSYLGVNTVGVVDGSVVFDDSDAGGASTDQVTAGVETHITETLYDEGLATPAGGCTWWNKVG